MKENDKLSATMISDKSNLAKLIASAIVLALGTAIITNYLTTKILPDENLLIFLGVSLVLIVVLALVLGQFRGTNKRLRLETLLAIDHSNRTVVSIPRFELSEKVSKTLQAVLLENDAFSNHWNADFDSQKTQENSKEALVDQELPNKEGEVHYYSVVKVTDPEILKPKEPKRSMVLLREAIEYVVVEELSMRLSTYFNGMDGSKYIKEYTRKDIPALLLENRILNLLTTPFEDRAIFAKAKMRPSDVGEIYSIYGTDGSHYSRFDLILPHGSRIQRRIDGSIELSNSRVFLSIRVSIPGSNTNLPSGFEKLYIGNQGPDLRLDVKKIVIEVSYRVKTLSYFMRRNWFYHFWVDEFVESLEEVCSFENFLTRIDWESNLTRLIIEAAKNKGAR